MEEALAKLCIIGVVVLFLTLSALETEVFNPVINWFMRVVAMVVGFITTLAGIAIVLVQSVG